MSTHDHSVKQQDNTPSTDITHQEPEFESQSGLDSFYAMRRAIQKPSRKTMTPNVVLQLQRTIGNKKILNLLSRKESDIKNTTLPSISKNNKKDAIQRVNILQHARNLRESNPKSLFCLVSFDDTGEVVAEYDSGKGYKGIPVDKGYNHDAEERMVMDFDRLVRAHERIPEHVQLVTAASPCDRICAGLIYQLAERYAHKDIGGYIKSWTITYINPYYGESADQRSDVMDYLNTTIGHTKIVTHQLHQDFEIR